MIEVRPSDPIFKYGWAQRSQDGHQGGDNPRQYHHDYLPDPNQFVYDQFHRRDAQGKLCQRYICEPEKRSVYADGHMGVGNGRWHGVPSERRDIIVANVRERWAEDDEAGRPRMTFGFYCGSDNNGDQWTNSSHGATGCLSLDNKEDTILFERNLLPWIELGVLSEVWWDAGARPEYWTDVKNLLEDQKARYGLHGGTEAIMHSREGDDGWPDDIKWYLYEGVPMLCISRYILDRDPYGALSWTDAEVHVMSSIHERVDGTPGNLTPAQARDFTSRGWTVGSWRPGQDDTVNLPDVPSPQPGGRRNSNLIRRHR